jgi:hypothetical protein
VTPLWGTIFGEAFNPDTPVLVHRIAPFHYSCTLIDEGICLEHRPTPLLAAWTASRHPGFDPKNTSTWVYRPRAMLVVGDALAHWDRLPADHKIWMFERFRVNLEDAKKAAVEFLRVQELMVSEATSRRTGKK